MNCFRDRDPATGECADHLPGSQEYHPSELPKRAIMLFAAWWPRWVSLNTMRRESLAITCLALMVFWVFEWLSKLIRLKTL